MRKKVIVVGGGTGGLTAAMLLAHKGLQVTVFEKQDELGGRSGALRMGDYTFDLGCTMLMLKFVLDDIFELVGEKTDDHLVCKRLSPLYQLCFGDLSLNMFSDAEQINEALEYSPALQAVTRSFLTAAAALATRDGAAGGQNR